MSFESPEYTANVDALGTLRILKPCASSLRKTRFYQASTSELYGLGQGGPSKGNHPVPSAQSLRGGKALRLLDHGELSGGHGMYACNGLLFNHESPRRGETIVTRKITRGLARIDAGLEDCLYMGNLEALRDWGHARDYVEMQWRMLQQEKPEDFVIATGRQETVRRFVELSASALGWGSLRWAGEGLEEVGRRNDTGEVVIRIDPLFPPCRS